MSDPTYEDFKNVAPGRPGWTRAFVATLTPGQPARVPLDGRRRASAQNALQLHRREHKVPLRTSTSLVPGELWVCLMKPEDVK